MFGDKNYMVKQEGINHLCYHTEDEMLIEMIDEEFEVVNVIGEPSDGDTSGYNISILDPRTKDEILEDVKKIQSQKV
jgi:hypothetical protein